MVSGRAGVAENGRRLIRGRRCEGVAADPCGAGTRTWCMQLQSEQVIGRSPEDVFDVLADARNEPEWNEWARRVEKASEGPIGRGTRFRAVIKNMGQIEFELQEYERPTRLQQHALPSSGESWHTYILEAVAGGTRVRQEARFEPRGVMRLLAPLMQPMMRRHMHQMERGLKHHLEAGQS